MGNLLIKDDFWTNRSLWKMGKELRDSYLYFFSNSHVDLAGFIDTAREILAAEMMISFEKYCKQEGELVRLGKLVVTDRYIWVVKKISHHVLGNENMRKGIKRVLEEWEKSDPEIKEMVGKYYKVSEIEIVYIGKAMPELDLGDIIPLKGKNNAFKEEGKEEKEEKKIKYGEFVEMTEKQHNSLISRYGQRLAMQMVEMLDVSIPNKKGCDYKSHYHAIRKWVAEAVLVKAGKPVDYDFAIEQVREKNLAKHKEMKEDMKKMAPELMRKIKEENLYGKK